MNLNPDPFDQSQPCQPGFLRIPDFMDVAVYDDALFVAYTKHDHAWQYIFNETGVPNTAQYREAHFNTEHFENSIMAQQWNEFVAANKRSR
jgi:hypothetical protein